MDNEIYANLARLKSLYKKNRLVKNPYKIPDRCLPTYTNFLKKDLPHCELDGDGVYRYKGKVIVPMSHAFFYITACHLRITWCCGDLDKRHYTSWVETTMIMTSLFWWPGIEKDVQSFCLHCLLCYGRNSFVEQFLAGNELSSKLSSKEPLSFINLHPCDKRKELWDVGLSGTPQAQVAEIAGFTDKAFRNFPDFSWKEVQKFYIHVREGVLRVLREDDLITSLSLRNIFEFGRGDFEYLTSFEDMANYPCDTRKYFIKYNQPVSTQKHLQEYLEGIEIRMNLRTFVILNQVMKMMHLQYWRESLELCYRSTTVQEQSVSMIQQSAREMFYMETLGPYNLVMNGLHYKEAYIVVVVYLHTIEMFAKFVTHKQLLQEALWSGIERVRKNCDQFLLFTHRDDELNSPQVRKASRGVGITIIQDPIGKHMIEFLPRIIKRYVQLRSKNEVGDSLDVADFIPNIVSLFNHSLLPGRKNIVCLPKQR